MSPPMPSSRWRIQRASVAASSPPAPSRPSAPSRAAATCSAEPGTKQMTVRLSSAAREP